MRTPKLPEGPPLPGEVPAAVWLRLVRAEFTIRPTFRCDVKWSGVTLANGSSGSPTLRPATLGGLQPVSSDRHLVGESRGRDLVSGSVLQVGQV